MTRPARFSGVRLELQPLLRIQRREVLEEQLLARLIGRLEVDRLDLDEREVALPFLRRTDLAGHGVAGLQIELPDLRRRDVDVVGTRQVVVVGRAQEAEAVGQHFEHAFREDEAALLGLRLQDLEDQLLLAHAGRAGDGHVLGDLRELLDAHVLQIGDVQASRRPRPAAGCAAPVAAGSAAARPAAPGCGASVGWRGAAASAGCVCGRRGCRRVAVRRRGAPGRDVALLD